MYKILLVDDEQIVIDSLRFILEKTFPNQVDIFTARSGSDAVQVCQSNIIEVAFMDISMPGLNGIDAIKKIKEFSPLTIIIVLTAFDRFDYAQQAVNLGVFEYLSKPVNRNRIIETIRNALNIVDNNKRKQMAEIQIREKLDSVVNIVESDFIYTLIFPSGKTGDIETYLDFFNIKNSSYYFITIEISDLPDSNRTLVYATLRDIILSSGLCLIGPLMHNRVVVFVPVETEYNSTQENLRSKLSLIHSKLFTRLGLRIKIGVSTIETKLDRSVSAYNESLNALISTEDFSGVFFSDDLKKNLFSVNEYPDAMEKKIIDRALSGDFQTVHTLFRDLCTWIVTQYPQDLSVLKSTLFSITVILRNKARQIQPLFGGFAVWKDSFKILTSIESYEKIEEVFLSWIDECIGIITEHKQNKISPIIQKACQYIQDNLSKDISLEEIAKQVEISPFYFSKLFKEEIGENFIDYITLNRLQQAKKMLQDRSLSIKEISVDCGYSDPNYFSKLFKRIVGLTPTEFRDLL